MPGVPGIFTEEQKEGWRKVVDAVHAKGGIMVMQCMCLPICNPSASNSSFAVWHQGRNTHSRMTGQPPVSASAVPITDSVHRWGEIPSTSWETPKAMTQGDIDRVKGEYVAAALSAREVGFDGIELHAANGYLPDQFMHSNINQRTDAYGGSPEKRCRFLLELASDLGQAVGFDRVGVRLAPFGFFNQTRGNERIKQWKYACRELAALDVAYVHLIEPRFDEVRSEQDKLRDLTSAAGAENGNDDPPFTEDQLNLKLFRAELGNTPCIVAGGYNFSNCWAGIEEVRHSKSSCVRDSNCLWRDHRVSMMPLLLADTLPQMRISLRD